MIKKSLVFASVISLGSLAAAQIEDIKPTVVPQAEQVKPVEVTKPAKHAKKVKMNIAVVNLQEIMGETKLDREANVEFTDLQQKLQKELEQIGREIKADDDQLKNQATMLTPEALQKKREALEEKNQKAQLQLNRANQQLQQKEFEIRNKLAQQIRAYAQQMVDQEGNISIVFDSNMALAHSAKIDVSDKLTKIIKTDMSKKEAAKKQAAAKPAPKHEAGKKAKAVA